MTQSHPPTGGVIEISALALERLWRLSNEKLTSSTYVPQADSLEVVYALVRTRLPDVIASHDLSDAFGLHGRHAAYTLEAASELGLMTRFSKGWFSRSELGNEIASFKEQGACRLFISTVLRLPIIRRVLSDIRVSSSMRTSRKAVEHLVENVSNGRYSGTTVGRRASTVVSWVLWLENNVWFT